MKRKNSPLSVARLVLVVLALAIAAISFAGCEGLPPEIQEILGGSGGAIIGGIGQMPNDNTGDGGKDNTSDVPGYEEDDVCHHSGLELVKEIMPDCVNGGRIQHYRCNECGRVFFDADATVEITDFNDAVISATGHNDLKLFDYTAPTCEREGNIKYYMCLACGQLFLDADAVSMIEDISYTVISDLGGAHDYDNDCDESCNICGETRYTEHIYDSLCDSECSVCHEARFDGDNHKYAYSCSKECYICGFEREAEEHLYYHPCDKYCDRCYEEREAAEHVYSNICDADCNVCHLPREVEGHSYDYDCDPFCNKCGTQRYGVIHLYDDDCDAICNVCSFERAVNHFYDNSCDGTCNA